MIWDGASHHRSQELRNFLAQTNQGQEWKVHCLRFARQRVVIHAANRIAFVRFIRAGVPPVVAICGAVRRVFCGKLPTEKPTVSFRTAEVAPYAPEENPIENVWGQLKQMLRSR